MLLLAKNIWESPRWLVSKNTTNNLPEEALCALQGLYPEIPRQELEDELAQIAEATPPISAQGVKSLVARHSAATVRGVLVNVLQQMSGINVVIYFGPTILASAGFTTTGAMVATIAVSITQLLATLLLVQLVDVVGRRPLALLGLLLMSGGLGVLMFAFGVQGSALDPRGLTTSILCVMGMFLYRAAFSLSIGPLPYIMTSELFPNEVRASGVALSLTAAVKCLLE